MRPTEGMRRSSTQSSSAISRRFWGHSLPWSAARLLVCRIPTSNENHGWLILPYGRRRQNGRSDSRLELFMRAYCGNREEAIQETLEADPVGAAVLAMMDQLKDQDQTEQWEGTCKDLLQRLESADDRAKGGRSWPKSPRGLSDRLRRLATFLRESGIHIIFPPKGRKGRGVLIIFRKGGETTATTATPPSNCSGSQSDTAGPAGGDCDHQGADVSLAGDQ